MESLTPEIAPFGIRTMLVEPGLFRTELLSKDSTTYAAPAGLVLAGEFSVGSLTSAVVS